VTLHWRRPVWIGCTVVLLLSSMPMHAHSSEIHPAHPTPSREQKSEPGHHLLYRSHRPKHSFMAETARLLGMSRKEIHQEIEAGKTLAQLAKAKRGWNEAQLVDQLILVMNKNQQQMLKEGRLTPKEAERRQQQAKVWLQKIVNQPLRDIHTRDSSQCKERKSTRKSAERSK